MITDEDLRDTAACHALTGLLAADKHIRMTFNDAVRTAYDLGQKMVAERVKHLGGAALEKRNQEQKESGLSDAEYQKALRLAEKILKRRTKVYSKCLECGGNMEGSGLLKRCCGCTASGLGA